MKKNRFLVFIAGLFFLLVLVFLFDLYIKKSFYDVFNNNLDYKIGVVQTSSAKLKSYINFFDEELNLLDTKKIYCAGLSHCWDFPKVFGKKVFMNIKGTDFLLKTKVLELDFKNKKYELFDVKQKFNNCMAVDKKIKNVYVANCVGDTNILKYNIKSKEKKRIVINDIYITQMKVYGNELFAFGNFFYPEPKSFIYIINTHSMKVIKKINISDYGLGQYDFIKINNYLFFTSQSQAKKNIDGQNYFECDNNILYKYDLAKNKIKKIELLAACPKQIFYYNNKLIISHDDWHNGQKNLSVYDLKTHETKLVDLKVSPYQIWLDKNKIYLTDRQKIFRYSADNFNCEKKYDLAKKNYYDNSFFVSGFFVIK